MASVHIYRLFQNLRKSEDFNWKGLENRIPFTPEVAFEFEKGGKVVICIFDFDIDEVGIKSSQSCYVSNFYKKGVDEKGLPIYTATATIYQEFTGYNSEG